MRNNKSCIRESFSYSPRTLLRNFVEAVPTELIFLLKNSFLSSAVFLATYFLRSIAILCLYCSLTTLSQNNNIINPLDARGIYIYARVNRSPLQGRHVYICPVYPLYAFVPSFPLAASFSCLSTFSLYSS